MNTHDTLSLQELLAATVAGRPPGALALVCLCADWCDTCRQWRPTFEAAARAWPQVTFRWLDVEDEADALGDVDVQNFPTLLIGTADAMHFHGPVLPQAGQIERLLRLLPEAP